MMPKLNEYFDTLSISFYLLLLIVCFAWYLQWRTRSMYDTLPTFRMSLPTLYRTFSPWNTHGNTTVLANFFQFVAAGATLFQKEGLFLMWLLWHPFVFIQKADILKEVISHPAAEAKSVEYKVLGFFFGSGLINSEGELWKKQRKMLTPAFKIEAIKDCISVFNKRSVEMVNHLKLLTNEAWTDIASLIGFYVLSIGSDCIMGMEIEGEQRKKDIEDYMDILTRLSWTGAHLMTKPWIINKKLWFWFTSTGRKTLRSLEIAQSINEKIMRERMKRLSTDNENSGTNSSEGITDKSLMDMLINTHVKDPNFSRKDIKDQVNTFMSAGFDTISLTLRYFFYLVGLYPEVQEKIFQELESIFDTDLDRMPTFEDLNRMNYLKCVIKETLRLYPPAPIIARTLQEDIQVGKYNLPKGTSVCFNLYMLHRDPDQFPCPEKFCPERYLTKNNRNTNPFAFSPFSRGSRSCIGQKFAMQEMMVITSHVLRNFKITSLDYRDKINVSWEIILINEEPLRVHLSPRY